MPNTGVVHCRHERFDVYIGRPSKWGNPFKLTSERQRDELIEKYRMWLLKQPELIAALSEIQGKTLGCWCKPKRCHGDVLAELADSLRRDDGTDAPKRKRKAA